MGTHRHSLIVCGIDWSAPSLAAARAAVDVAERLGGEVLFVHVVEPVPVPASMPAHHHAGVRRAAYAHAEEATEEWLREHDLPDDRWLVREGDPATELVDVATERGATLLVVGSRGRGPLTAAILGSVSAEVSRRAACPVMIVPGAADHEALHHAEQRHAVTRR